MLLTWTDEVDRLHVKRNHPVRCSYLDIVDVPLHIFRSEFRASHGEWVNPLKPNLGPGIRELVHEAITSEDEPAMKDLHAVRTC